jgi:hypothetical protein
MRAGFSPAARASDVYFEAMNLASPHSAITSAHCLVGVGYTDTVDQQRWNQSAHDHQFRHQISQLRGEIQAGGFNSRGLIRRIPGGGGWLFNHGLV